MVDENSGSETSVRPPTRDDLIRICRDLNEQGAQYIVLGGMALIEWGLDRGTMDIDLLVDSSLDNVGRITKALAKLPDGAAREVLDSDVKEYNVVRIHDEFTVDLMGSACGLSYGESLPLVVYRDLDGVRIPFASLELLWKTKQTYRDKDALDRVFLRTLLDQKTAQ